MTVTKQNGSHNSSIFPHLTRRIYLGVSVFAGQGFTGGTKRKAIQEYKKLLRKERKAHGEHTAGHSKALEHGSQKGKDKFQKPRDKTHPEPG